MPDTGEVMADVSLEDPAVGAPVLAVILPHEITEAVEAEMGPFPHLGTVVVQDERPGEDRV